MKIGILTFHDEINFGSLLQAFAMQAVLQEMGHDAYIIDRWYEFDQHRIYGILRCRSFKELMRWIVSVICGCGAVAQFIRQVESRRFIRGRLRLTSYHFHEWKDAPKDLGLDIITVGSDQVWHPGNRPSVYLLEGVEGPKKMAYAASFSATNVPDGQKDLYARCLKEFKAIGVREKEGVDLVRSLGSCACHVVDPTLLLDAAEYNKLLDIKPESDGRLIVCYFLLEDAVAVMRTLGIKLAEQKIKVKLFLQDAMLPLPTSFQKIVQLLKFHYYRIRYGIDVRVAAGPCEFVSAISSAECVFTNSFHALMFSIIYRRNVRVVLPTNPIRKGMSARMKEFAGGIIEGPLISRDLDDAINSYNDGVVVKIREDCLSKRIEASRSWLKNAMRV